MLTLRVKLPAVVTVDLRIVSPTSVLSKLTQAEAGFKHGDGVRFAPLPAIMAAKKKPLDVKTLADARSRRATSPPSTSNSSARRNAPVVPKSKTWPSWSKSSPPFRR